MWRSRDKALPITWPLDHGVSVQEHSGKRDEAENSASPVEWRGVRGRVTCAHIAPPPSQVAPAPLPPGGAGWSFLLPLPPAPSSCIPVKPQVQKTHGDVDPWALPAWSGRKEPFCTLTCTVPTGRRPKGAASRQSQDARYYAEGRLWGPEAWLLAPVVFLLSSLFSSCLLPWGSGALGQDWTTAGPQA